MNKLNNTIILLLFTPILFYCCGRRQIPLSKEEIKIQDSITSIYPLAQIHFEHDLYPVENKTGDGTFYISIYNSKGEDATFKRKDSIYMNNESLQIALATCKILSNKKCYKHIYVEYYISKMDGPSYYLLFEHKTTFSITMLDSIAKVNTKIILSKRINCHPHNH